jgi:hypothetical protein
MGTTTDLIPEHLDRIRGFTEPECHHNAVMSSRHRQCDNLNPTAITAKLPLIPVASTFTLPRKIIIIPPVSFLSLARCTIATFVRDADHNFFSDCPETMATSMNPMATGTKLHNLTADSGNWVGVVKIADANGSGIVSDCNGPSVLNRTCYRGIRLLLESRRVLSYLVVANVWPDSSWV